MRGMAQRIKTLVRERERTRESAKAIAKRYDARPGDKTLDELPPLLDQHQKFVAHYVIHFNASRAARESGFSEKSCRAIGWELLTRPDIQAHIRAMRKQLGEMHFDLANQITGQLRAMAGADPTKMLDADGNVIDPKDWEDAEKLLIVGFDIEERMVGEGDAQELIRVKKVKLESRKGVLDSLAKITGQFIDRTQQLGKNGQPIDPQGPAAPIINVTFVREAPPPQAPQPGKKGDKDGKRKRRRASARE